MAAEHEARKLRQLMLGVMPTARPRPMQCVPTKNATPQPLIP